MALDNVVLTETIPPPAVPEPSTILLFSSAIAGLFVLRKKH
ncbi:PEP-CTERM sorting domain-containing protein [Candidatus Desantisbacteria bacterium]|nr:PEP-CTERM sorting domain-containing protein [Candidatus Desantisbacteria bacterium]